MTLADDMRLLHQAHGLSLADDMRYAAEILKKANQRMGLSPQGLWRADELQAEAAHVEAEDRENIGREMLVDELALAMARGVRCGYRTIARELIENGWTKT
jgi:hypothetical protein